MNPASSRNLRRNLAFYTAVAAGSVAIAAALAGEFVVAIAAAVVATFLLTFVSLAGRPVDVARLERRLERASRSGLHVFRAGGARSRVAAADTHRAMGELALTPKGLAAAERVAQGIDDWPRTANGMPDPDAAGQFVKGYLGFFEALKAAGTEGKRSPYEPIEAFTRTRLGRASGDAHKAAQQAFATHERDLSQLRHRLRGTHPASRIESRRVALATAVQKQAEEFEHLWQALDDENASAASIAGRRYAEAVALTYASSMELRDVLRDRDPARPATGDARRSA